MYMYKHKITGIMACDPHGVIALNNKLPWHIPEEIEFFRKTINGQNIILGYKTFLEMPMEFFKNHFCVVFTKKNILPKKDNVIFVSNIEEFMNLNLPITNKTYMIGGAELAKLFLENNLLHDFILSIINIEYQGDKFFPLETITSWPRQLIKQNKDFSIYYYKNPHGAI